MAKTDAPALQERLATYRNGSELRAVVTQPKNEKLNRKFHAILNRVIADCETPWQTVEEVNDSLKMALGGVTRQVSDPKGDVVSRYPGFIA